MGGSRPEGPGQRLSVLGNLTEGLEELGLRIREAKRGLGSDASGLAQAPHTSGQGVSDWLSVLAGLTSETLAHAKGYGHLPSADFLWIRNGRLLQVPAAQRC